jgi:hypothetical protein
MANIAPSPVVEAGEFGRIVKELKAKGRYDEAQFVRVQFWEFLRELTRVEKIKALNTYLNVVNWW